MAHLLLLASLMKVFYACLLNMLSVALGYHDQFFCNILLTKPVMQKTKTQTGKISQ